MYSSSSMNDVNFLALKNYLYIINESTEVQNPRRDFQT